MSSRKRTRASDLDDDDLAIMGFLQTATPSPSPKKDKGRISGSHITPPRRRIQTPTAKPALRSGSPTFDALADLDIDPWTGRSIAASSNPIPMTRPSQKRKMDASRSPSVVTRRDRPSNSPCPAQASTPTLNRTTNPPSNVPFPSRATTPPPTPNHVIKPENKDEYMNNVLTSIFSGHGDEQAAVDQAETKVPGLNLQLKEYQALDRHWMNRREEGGNEGGMLCYDVGLGKTLQICVLFLDQFKKRQTPTLVVTEASVMHQTALEIANNITGALVLEHHGPGRTNDPEDLLKYHFVLTTYDTLKSEFGVRVKDDSELHSAVGARDDSKIGGHEGVEAHEQAEHFGRVLHKDNILNKAGKVTLSPRKRGTGGHYALSRVQWHRAVLDEGHRIRNHQTAIAQACFDLSLNVKRCWIVTATPIQNSGLDLYSYFRYIKLPHWSNWDNFVEDIVTPLRSAFGWERGIERLKRLLGAIMLFRRKTDTLNGRALIELPARIEIDYALEFSPEERAIYDKREQPAAKIYERLMRGEKLKKDDQVFARIMKLRQTCNHVRLPKSARGQVHMPGEEDADDEDADPDSAMAEDIAGCEAIQITASRKRKADPHPWPSPPEFSTKVRKIVELLVDIRSLPEEGGRPHKVIIFSVWNSFLDLLDMILGGERIHRVRLHGAMDLAERERVLRQMRTSTTTNVILITTAAGSAGIDLSCCNHVILCDPWWNPAREEQAFGRAHRIGQTRPVKIHKLAVRRTIEDGMRALQAKKRDFARMVLSGTVRDREEDRREDLKTLFRPSARRAEPEPVGQVQDMLLE